MKIAETTLEELWFAEDDSDLADNKASQSAAAKAAEIQGLKPFPVVAQKVLAVLGDSEFKVLQVTKALEEDPSLAAGVLRMANSPLFAGAQKCDSINQAFLRLGAQVVREVVTAVAMMGLFPDKDGFGKIIRDHCAATAGITQVLARDFTPKHTQGIFLCGLMHDIGKMLLLDTGEIDYAAPECPQINTPDAVHLYERNKLGYDHAVLGALVLKTWDMAEPIPQVVAWHHQPTRAYRDHTIGPMVAMLRIAGAIENRLATNPSDYEDFVDKLATTVDCEYAQISADHIKDRWNSLYEVRADSFSLFG